MHKVLSVALAALALLASAPASAAMLSGQFQGRYGSLEIFDPQSKLSYRVNTPRLAERLPPCSTYLIAHSAIALGTGAIKEGEDQIIFDPAQHAESELWPRSWRRDQTLDTAMRNSVQWYAQELTLRVGSGKIDQQLKRIKYGNADINGGVDRFWMSSLRISGLEQVDFLRAFREHRLGFSPAVTRRVQESMVVERTQDYTIYGKYGSCPLEDGVYLGWLIGYLERANKVWYYALNLDGEKLSDFAGVRLQIVRGAMDELGFIELPKPEPEPAPEVIPVDATAVTVP